MENTCTLNLKPSSKTLSKIKEWLFEEYQISKTGFYCNWNIISPAFCNNEIITFEQNQNIIGFVIFTAKDFYASIDIFEINSNFRKKGYGKLFFEMLCSHYRSTNFKVVKLFCQPVESELFWIKMGCIKFPNISYSISNLTYFKPLIKVKSIVEKSLLDRFELWDIEPYQIQGKSPKWIWEYQDYSELSEVPILFPCNRNWNLRLIINNTIVKESKIKYFSKNYDLEKVGNFLFIDNLDFLDI